MSGPDDARSRGWCPSLFEPMQSGDGVLLRIKPRASRLAAADARWLAAAALEHGNGAIELTNRGNLQLRGFSAGSAASFAAQAVSMGLAEADPAAERRRTLLVSPLAGDDPACDPDTLAVARTLEAALLAEPGLDGLPGKFGFVVDGGGTPGLAGLCCDVGLRAAAGGWLVEAGGAVGACSAAEAPFHALRLARAALACLDAKDRPSRRPGCGPMLFQAAGLRQTATVAPPAAAVPATVGPLPNRAFGIGLPPGRLDAGLLAALAILSERLGDATLRVTPWRTLLLAGLADGAEAVLRPALAGHLLHPDDPRLRTASCIGAPGCARGSVPAPADAARLGLLLQGGLFLHVSGCAKGCGHPAAAPLTLVGRDGRYDLVRNGRAGDVPVRRGLTADAAAALLRDPSLSGANEAAA